MPESDDGPGRRIRSRREAIGLSREALADALGWFEAQIEDCENALFSPSRADLAMIATVLGVSAGHLRGGDDLAAERDAALAPASSADAGAIDLFHAFSRISDPRKRSLLVDLALIFAGPG